MPSIRLFIASAEEWGDVADALKDVIEDKHPRSFVVRTWRSAFTAGRTPVLYHVQETVADSDFGVFVLGPTDVTSMETGSAPPTLTPRDNVIFELGLYIGLHGSDRVFLVYVHDDRREAGPEIRIPSDFDRLLHGQAISWLKVSDARSGERGRDDMKSALSAAASDVIARVETVTQQTLERTRGDTASSGSRSSMWSSRFRELGVDDLEPGDLILHPLLGVGTFVEQQSVAGADVLVVRFADGIHRVPRDERIFHPIDPPAD